jgi:hypothetical protein
LIAFLLLAALFSKHPAKPTPSPAPTVLREAPPVALSRCVEADARLDVEVSTVKNVAGDAFWFTTIGDIAATKKYPAVPKGSRGYGVIAYATHAGAGGKSGTIILEPRFVALDDGRRVPIMSNPAGDQRVQSGKSKNAPSVPGFVPGIGLMFGGYNAFHRGKEVVLPKGTPLLLLVGDDLASGNCYITLPR